MESTSHSTPAGVPAGIFSHEQLQHALKSIHNTFPQFKHEQHGPVMNVNKVADEQLTVGQRIADRVAATVGSWPFIIIQSIILALWIILNCIAWIQHWDPYPFILLNLALSFQAAYAAPFVMMSQNRQAAKDRLTAENDYKTDVKGEQEICHIMDHLNHQDSQILQIVKQLQEQTVAITQQEGQILNIVEQLKVQNELLTRQEAMTLEVAKHLETQHQQLQAQRDELLTRISTLLPEEDKNMLNTTDSNR